MSETVETILLYTIGAGLLSIVYGFFTGKNILNQSTGNAKMQDIASAIQIGAKAYLARQYKTIAIVGIVVLVIVSIAFSPLVGLGYLVGRTRAGRARGQEDARRPGPRAAARARRNRRRDRRPPGPAGRA